jgi:hypothetical protein
MCALSYVPSYPLESLERGGPDLARQHACSSREIESNECRLSRERR